MNRIAFYPIGENVQLPERHVKAYVDSFCDEFKRTDTDTKLMHLFYVSDKGLDILSLIREFLNDHPEISEDSIKRTLAQFIAQLRYPGGEKHEMDRLETEDFIAETLPLEEIHELLLIEIRLRFSFQEDDLSITFSQKYLRWSSLRSLIKSMGRAGMEEYIINPTGYYPVTEKELSKENRWPELAELYLKSDWYDPKLEIAYPDSYEKQVIEAFNRTAKGNCRLVLGAPAEPWRGNPLKAKVIILSLNPGFKYGVNDKIKENVDIRLREGAMAELCKTLDFHAQGLLYKQDSYVKTHDEFRDKVKVALHNVGYGDALNEMGDYYWYKNISRLNIHGQKDYEFFQNFAIVQYCAYTSACYKDFPKGTVLPSQELTKELIRYLAYNRKDVQFLIMRSSNKWKELLDPDVWEKMQSRLIINTNMSQSLSEKNLGSDNFSKITKLLGK